MTTLIHWTAYIVLVIDCFLLILFILAQESKSQGMGGLGGGMDMSFGGHAQRTAKRITTALAIIFAVCIITIILVKPEASKGRRPVGVPTESAAPVIPDLPDVNVSAAPAVTPGN